MEYNVEIINRLTITVMVSDQGPVLLNWLCTNLHTLVFMCLQYKSFENAAGKGENAFVTSNFSFSPSVFYPFGEVPAMFIKF